MSYRFKIYLLVILVSLFIGVIKFRKLSVASKGLTILLIATFISELVSRVLAASIKNSNPAYHFYIPISFFLSVFIMFAISNNAKLKVALKITSPLILLMLIGNSLFFQDIYIFNSNAQLISILTLLTFSIFLFLEIIDKDIYPFSIIDSDSIIIIAFLWFNLTSFLFYLLLNYFLRNNISMALLNGIHFVSNLVYYTLFGISLLKAKK